MVLPAALPPHPEPAGSTSEPLTAGTGQGLSTRQAHEAAYRLVARYYDYERIPPILQLLDALRGTGDEPSDETGWAVSAVWEDCVQETLDGVPLPELSPPWES